MSRLFKDDSDYSNPISIKGKSSWEDNSPTESEVECFSQDAKDKVTKQLKRALAALDTAVQKWYDANAPENGEHYAACHIRSYPGTSVHISDITLCTAPGDYITIKSLKDRRIN
jgi:hypothetical protein